MGAVSDKGRKQERKAEMMYEKRLVGSREKEAFLRIFEEGGWRGMFLLAWNAKRYLTDRIDHQEASRCEGEDTGGRGVSKAVEAHELAVSVVDLIVGA